MTIKLTSFIHWCGFYLIALMLYLGIFPQENSILDTTFRIILSILAIWLVFIISYHSRRKLIKLGEEGKLKIKIKL